jgi:proteasome lid subunit RPN8/RPN11
MLILPNDAVAKEIRDEGERLYPNECCGIILGQFSDFGARKAVVILPVNNARESEERYHRFVINPEDYIHAETEAERQGLDIIGAYHSHPEHPAAPSDYDREHALPNSSYIIISIEKGRATELTSWELTSDRRQFMQEEIQWQ